MSEASFNPASPASEPQHFRAAWLRPKQTDLIPGKGSSASVSSNRLSYGCPTTIFRDPGTDTDIISAQHYWTGELETAGPGCYDAFAMTWAAGLRMLVMSRIRHATIVSLTARSRPKRAAKHPEKSLPDNNS